MIGWLEASWGNVIVVCVLGLVLFVLLLAALEELRGATRKPPAPESEATVSPRPSPPPVPGLIPPAPVTHPSPVVRLADVRECGCAWVWRGHAIGWKQAIRGNGLACQQVPTPDQYDWWAAQLWDSR